MDCTVCGVPAVISRKYSDMCQFCWDCLRHELMIRLNAIRDFGAYHKDNRGPNFFAIYWTGKWTLGYGLYVPTSPREAMNEALRTAVRNGWHLLRVDTQKTLTDIFVSEDYTKYMTYSQLAPLPYDATQFGELSV
jgi:hypothetical protein